MKVKLYAAVKLNEQKSMNRIYRFLSWEQERRMTLNAKPLNLSYRVHIKVLPPFLVTCHF